MNKIILAATFTVAVALPSIVIAQGTSTPRATLRIPAPGTVICRPVRAGEKTDATMGTVQLRCRNVNLTRIRTAISAINTTMGSLTTAHQAQMQTEINTLENELDPEITGGLNQNSGE